MICHQNELKILVDFLFDFSEIFHQNKLKIPLSIQEENLLNHLSLINLYFSFPPTINFQRGFQTKYLILFYKYTNYFGVGKLDLYFERNYSILSD